MLLGRIEPTVDGVCGLGHLGAGFHLDKAGFDVDDDVPRSGGAMDGVAKRSAERAVAVMEVKPRSGVRAIRTRTLANIGARRSRRLVTILI